MKVKFYFIFTLSLIFACSSSQKQLEQSKPKVKKQYYTFAIMPFEENIPYPYQNDIVREALIIALVHNHCAIIADNESWSKITELDFLLVNLNEKRADQVAKLLNADVIIYGESDFDEGFRQFRHRGMWEEEIRVKPILVKAYDALNGQIIFRERLRMEENITPTVNTIPVNEVIERLQVEGYIGSN